MECVTFSGVEQLLFSLLKTTIINEYVFNGSELFFFCWALLTYFDWMCRMNSLEKLHRQVFCMLALSGNSSYCLRHIGMFNVFPSKASLSQKHIIRIFSGWHLPFACLNQANQTIHFLERIQSEQFFAIAQKIIREEWCCRIKLRFTTFPSASLLQ